MNKWLISVSVILALASGSAAAGDAAAGQAKAAPCGACHGMDGNAAANALWPKLAGQHPDYIAKQIMDFKSGARVDPLMAPQANLLATDQDVADVAAFFASQTQTGGTAKEDMVALGQRLYRGGNDNGVAACQACHGPAGMGAPGAKFPRISGQHADYIAKQLNAFRDGSRANDPNNMMGMVAARMTDAEIAAVSQYVQGLNR